MKTTKLVLMALVTTVMVACSDKKSTNESGNENATEEAASFTATKEMFVGKGRTCWKLTAGPSMFGMDICFNSNGTVNMGEGFGPFQVENNKLTLSDNNGVVISNGTKLSFDIKSADEKSFVILSNGKEMVFEKQ